MSRLRLRRLGPTERLWLKLESDFFISDSVRFKEKFGLAIYEIVKTKLEQKRKMLIQPTEDLCLRWLFSETDLIPGLIVDVFRDTLVCQLLTSPIETFWDVLKEILSNVFLDVTGVKPVIIENRSASVRTKEGLSVIAPNESKSDWYNWNGLKWWLTPSGSQKTGAYFDQRENHTHTATWAQKLNLHTAWDLCSFEGGFGLHLAKNKIATIAVDQSEKALEIAQKNANENNISQEFYRTQNQDVFEFLRNQFDQQNKVDLIVLDPPAFAKNQDEVRQALKGYKELNLRSIHAIKPGGLLVSCTCSRSITRDLYYDVLQSAAHNARRTIKVLEVRGPSADHAPLLGFPESDYLQAFYLQVD